VVTITCPQCNYSRNVAPERIPPGIQSVRCPRCGSRFPYQLPEGHVSRDQGKGTPWERRSQLGLWPSVKQTLLSFIFSPKRSYGAMPVGGGLREPLAFGLLAGSIGEMFTFFWQFVIASRGGISPSGDLFLAVSSPLFFLLLILLAPVLTLISLFVWSCILHVLLFVVRGNTNGFEATFRVMAYSQAAQVWCVIPFVGGPIGWCWRVVIQVIGLKEAHRISYGKVIVALLLPVALFVVMGVALVFFLIMRF
jgi:predicted Zn finger-like uncharacterized protein